MTSENPIKDLMYKIAKRARELGEDTMDGLRLTAGYNCDTPGQAREMNRYKKRGELIEEILIEEFEYEVESLERELR